MNDTTDKTTTEQTQDERDRFAAQIARLGSNVFSSDSVSIRSPRPQTQEEADAQAVRNFHGIFGDGKALAPLLKELLSDHE